MHDPVIKAIDAAPEWVTSQSAISHLIIGFNMHVNMIII